MRTLIASFLSYAHSNGPQLLCCRATAWILKKNVFLGGLGRTAAINGSNPCPPFEQGWTSPGEARNVLSPHILVKTSGKLHSHLLKDVLILMPERHVPVSVLVSTIPLMGATTIRPRTASLLPRALVSQSKTSPGPRWSAFSLSGQSVNDTSPAVDSELPASLR